MRTLPLFKLTSHYTRSEHGSKPFKIRWVKSIPVEIQVEDKRFFAIRDFYRHINGKPLSWSLARYINLSSLEDKTDPVWDLLLQKELDSPTLGIDLQNRSHEVVKLLHAGFGSLIKRTNLDPDDVVQEVFKALLVRNNGKCPWDLKKSSFGHYVHLVTGGVINNLLKRRTTDKRKGETVEISGMRKLATSDSAESDTHLRNDIRRKIDPNAPFGGLAISIFDQVAEGKGPKEIGTQMGIDPRRVAKAVQYIREVTQEWMEAR